MSDIEDDIPICGWKREDKPHPEHVSCCLYPPGHEGNHVVAVADRRHVYFYEVLIEESALKLTIRASLRDGEELSEQEQAVILMVLRPELWSDYGG